MNKKIILDVCGTLYHSNTTFDFIDYFLDKKNKCIIKRKLLKFWIFKFFFIVLGKLFKNDIYRRLYIRLLKDFPQNELTKEAKIFTKEILETKKILQIHNIIDDIKKDDIIICSASLDIVIKEISSILNIKNYFATNLIFEGGYCLGEIRHDLLGRKDKLFNKVDLVITDNKSDLLLIKKSSKYIIVSEKKNLYFWKKNKITVDIII
ncbi:hypothetical protein KKJ04_03385 [Xenorhabdus bovienii]|uniref:haloacid dehalogenase-like hydrolase n=1 Tax=Xenorhabdus bovienii TaxID=40576 RepID=UPI0023B23BC3|nr:haloacid dehalogenase-like hydrolase [Xenorhabdus bovienii]MDE9444683.1 hypothetical protein [Xenorhabdus bovienii]